MDTLAIIASIASVSNIMATIFGGLIFIGKMNSRLDVQNVQIDLLQKTTENIGKIITSTALADQKIASHTDMIAVMQRQIDELRRGEGLIVKRHEHA